MLSRMCTELIQANENVLHHAGYTAPARRHELLIDHTDQERICRELSRS